MFGVWDSFYKVLLSRQKVEARKTIANMNFQQSIYVFAVSIVFKMKNDVLQFKIQFVATWKPENPGNVSNFLCTLYTDHTCVNLDYFLNYAHARLCRIILVRKQGAKTSCGGVCTKRVCVSLK